MKSVKAKGYKSVRFFNVVFETENGDVLRFYVPEEIYHGIDFGQQGVVNFIDGDLYGFELD